MYLAQYCELLNNQNDSINTYLETSKGELLKTLFEMAPSEVNVVFEKYVKFLSR